MDVKRYIECEIWGNRDREDVKLFMQKVWISVVERRGCNLIKETYEIEGGLVQILLIVEGDEQEILDIAEEFEYDFGRFGQGAEVQVFQGDII